MTKRAFGITTAILILSLGTLAYAEGISRWDAGLAGGTVLFSDTVGYSGTAETRAYLAEPVAGVELYAGAGGLFQYTSTSQHTMTDFYALVLGGVDWFYPGTVMPALKPLALRAQLALGGGYTSDLNSDDQQEGSAGFLLLPSVPTTALANCTRA